MQLVSWLVINVVDLRTVLNGSTYLLLNRGTGTLTHSPKVNPSPFQVLKIPHAPIRHIHRPFAWLHQPHSSLALNI